MHSQDRYAANYRHAANYRSRKGQEVPHNSHLNQYTIQLCMQYHPVAMVYPGESNCARTDPSYHWQHPTPSWVGNDNFHESGKAGLEYLTMSFYFGVGWGVGVSEVAVSSRYD